jgi:general secretion pathway protein A
MANSLNDFSALRENPFNVTPDSRFLVLTENVRQSFVELAQAIHARMGLILLTGEVGTGKTVLLHLLLDHLRQEDIPRSFIFNPHLSANDLFKLALADFGVPLHSSMNVTPIARLQYWLAEPDRLTCNAVLMIDEAQGLALEVFEEIRLLLNLVAARGKTLQIILAGQPELDEKLKRPEFRAIRQRINIRCATRPLTREESDEYMSRWLRLADPAGAIALPSEAADLLYLYSRGIPRVLNLLSERSLIRARAARSQSLSLEVVEEVARQLQFDDYRPVAQTTRLNRPPAAGARYLNPDSIAVSSRGPQAPRLGSLEKKYPVIELPETFLSRSAEVAAAAEKSNSPEVLLSIFDPMTPETHESAPAAPLSDPAHLPRLEMQPSEIRRMHETPGAPSSSLLWLPSPSVSRKSIQHMLYRIRQSLANFWQSAQALATASIRHVRFAKFAHPNPWNRPWQNFLRWFQRPLRTARPPRGVSRLPSFMHSVGHSRSAAQPGSVTAIDPD